MTEEQLEEIASLAESLDCGLVNVKNLTGLSPSIQLQGLAGIVKQVRDALAKIYQDLGGDELDLQG